ncbi:hypothetical protein HN51_060901 [Arachis hypogaea]|nr:GDSL esterase/lipase At1g29660-like [Arachis hypogaea]XP_029153339.1 GDSL esterase/lipase At1g29660-like [Arachis hypogaea]QHO04391.1 GDSL esterase/lipase [Arachis hypogaea]
MGCESKLWLVFLLMSGVTIVVGEPQVPCLFIFGDSLSDSGNNNKLSTDCKANYFPYGIDFPDGPTGRYTNGLTIADFITQLLGFDHLIPPYANYGGYDIKEGVNYASGSAGIRYDTGKHLGDNVELEKQLQNHKVIISEITKQVGGRVENVEERLKKCLYYVNVGSNDFINNYFLPQHYRSSEKYSPEEFAAELVKQYSQHLKALHQLGASKFVLVGLHLLGCIPHEIITHGKNHSLCATEVNNASRMFNNKLEALSQQLNKQFSHSNFIYVNTPLMASHIPQLNHPRGHGGIFRCCEVGSNGQCKEEHEPCWDRSLHAFFDDFHPTEIVNRFFARYSYHSPSKSYTLPMDISQLVRL